MLMFDVFFDVDADVAADAMHTITPADYYYHHVSSSLMKVIMPADADFIDAIC